MYYILYSYMHSWKHEFLYTCTSSKNKWILCHAIPPAWPEGEYWVYSSNNKWIWSTWNPPPVSQKAKNKKWILSTDIQLNNTWILHLKKYNNGCLLLDQTKPTYTAVTKATTGCFNLGWNNPRVFTVYYGNTVHHVRISLFTCTTCHRYRSRCGRPANAGPIVSSWPHPLNHAHMWMTGALQLFLIRLRLLPLVLLPCRGNYHQ